MNRLILFMLFLPLTVLMSAGTGERLSDPLYGVGFPRTLRPSQPLPDVVEYGTVTLRGMIVAIGNSPFARPALRVETGDETYYYILQEGDESLMRTEPVTLQADLVIEPVYFIDNTLASIEYHLRNIEEGREH